MNSSILYLQNRTHRAGAQTCLERLLRHAEIRRWNPALLCSPGGWLVEECVRNGMKVVEARFPSSRSLPALFFANAAFARRVARSLDVRSIRPGIVHANDHTEGLLGLQLARRVGAKTAMFLRSPTMTRYDYFKYRCHRYDFVAAVGDEFRERVQAWDSRREISLIHDGLFNDEVLPAKPRSALPPRRVLVIGSPLVWKGWADLTEAAFGLEERGLLPEMQFDFTGVEPEFLENDLQIERLSRTRCSFIGRVETFRDLVRGYDLVINPSRAESFGMAAVEVLAAGVPLLSSRTGVIEQVLQSPEMLFPPNDPPAMGEALRHVLEQWQTVDFGVERAQQNILKLFPIEATAALVSESYERLSAEPIAKPIFRPTPVRPVPAVPRRPESKRVLLMLTNLAGGGAERAMINFARGLLERGHRPQLLLFEHVIDYQVPDDLEVSFLTEPGRRISTGWVGKRVMARSLRQWYRESARAEPYDVVISTLPFADEVAHLAGLQGVWYRIPNTLSAEIDALARVSGRRAARRRARYHKLYGGQRVISVSKGVADDLVGRMRVQPAKIVTVFNPFDFGEIRGRASAAEADVPVEPFILHVGRFQPQKRHDLLLDAFKLAELPHRLVLLTHGSDELSALIASRGLTSRVMVAGFRENPFPWYARAAAVVLSSDREGMPNVLVESLICGTPVVSTDCPSGPREVLTGGMKHWLVPCGDASTLAAKMREVVEHPPEIDPAVLRPFSKELTLDVIESLAEDALLAPRALRAAAAV